MTDALASAVIAVDGGGSRCRLALVLPGRRIEHETGPANVTTDFAGAVGRLAGGLDVLAEAAGLAPDAVRALPAHLGLAGVKDDALAARAVAALGLRRARVTDDWPLALRGALNRADGAIAHCGTGSFVAAQNEAGLRHAGGWGAVLGDEASAQWIGRRALAAALDTVDGVASATAMTDALLAAFEGSGGIVRFAAAATPDAFGRIARSVTAAAETGDAAADAILRGGADYLARMLRGLGWQEGTALCLTGGIGPHYAARLPDAMRRALAPPRGSPLDGAVALALDHALARPPSEKDRRP